MSLTSVIQSFRDKLDADFFKKFVVEAFQSTAVAGAVGGLTFAANDMPYLQDHFGLPVLVTTQLTAAILYARAFVSGLNK